MVERGSSRDVNVYINKSVIGQRPFGLNFQSRLNNPIKVKNGRRN